MLTLKIFINWIFLLNNTIGMKKPIEIDKSSLKTKPGRINKW